MDLERYWKRVEAAPVGVALRVIVANRSGEHYALPYPCSLTAAGWVNAATGISLALRPTHWQLHVETLPSKRAWIRRSPAHVRIGPGGRQTAVSAIPFHQSLAVLFSGVPLVEPLDKLPVRS
jgi:hypothetical protein